MDLLNCCFNMLNINPRRLATAFHSLYQEVHTISPLSSIGLAREWCLAGRRVLYTTAANLVQQLLEAKLSLKLKQIIKKFDYFEILIIDDISYVPYNREETDVLFTLLAERYEMRSVLISQGLIPRSSAS